MPTTEIEMFTCIPILEEKIEKLERENKQLKEKIALRNKEKTDVCNKLNSQTLRRKWQKREITNLVAKNQRLKETISKIKHILNNQINYREFVDMINDIEDILKEV